MLSATRPRRPRHAPSPRPSSLRVRRVAPTGAGNGRSAVAAFYPLAWVTGRVAGDGWTVENLTGPGTEPHDLALAIKQTAALAGGRPGRPRARLPAGGRRDCRDQRPDAAGRRRGRGGRPACPPPSTSTSGRGARGHDHGDLDPHFWQDPLLMADLADAVADQLAEIDPDGATTYADNAAGAARRARDARPGVRRRPRDLRAHHDRGQPRGLLLPRALRAALRGDRRPLPRRRADPGRPRPAAGR